MVLVEYFAAVDDATAASVADEHEQGGPEAAGFDTVHLRGFEPVVVLARLEAVLTGCDYDEASARPRSGQPVSSTEEEQEAFVFGITDTLHEALVDLAADRVETAGAEWAATEELILDRCTPEAAAEAIRLLSGLAVRARAAGMRIYCLWSL